MKKIFLIHLIVVLQLLSFIESFSQDFWKRTDGPYGAKISKIAIDTSKGNNYIYLATKTDGVYRSANGGASWSSINNVNAYDHDPGKLTLHASVNDIAIGPTGIIFAATDSIGIFKRVTTTWSKKAVPNNPIIHCIYILNNGTMLAGTNDKSIARSTNNGDNWNSITTGLSSVTNVYGIVQANNGDIFIGTDQGIYKSNSTDNGGSWATKDIAPGKVNCMTKSSDGLILMAGSDKGIFASSNNGDTWNLQSNNMPANTKVISLAFHKDGMCIAGTESNGLFYSYPPNYSWTAYNTGLEATRIRAVATSPTGELYAGTNFAFYKSPDNSSGWESSNTGLGLRTINRFASLAFKADVLAATDLGIYKTTNSGDSWTQLNQGLEDYLDIAALVVARNGSYFAGTKGDGLYYSTNQGDDWKKLNDPGFTATHVTTLDTNSQGILWAGTRTQGVFKSNDITGMSWSRGNGDNIENMEILSFVTAANDVTYAGTANDGLYRKADGVTTWSKVSAGYLGLGLNTIHSLAYIDIGVNGVVYAATNSGIRRSNDNSLGPWYSPTGSLSGAVIAITSCEKGWVLVSTKGALGVYIDSTTKNGDTWVKIEASGINSVTTQSLAVSGSGYIFAGTIGGGCFRSVESTSAKVLVVNTKQSDTMEVQQGDKVTLSVEIKDGLKQMVQGATITVNNDLGLTLGNLTTDASGLASIEVTIPPNLPDSPPGEYYTVTFQANKIGFIESLVKTVYLDVQRQKIFLEVVPKDESKGEIWRDWEQEYEFEIYAKNKDDAVLPNMTICVDDKLTGILDTLTTDANGEAYYKDTVPINHPEQTYIIYFKGVDPTKYYFDSDQDSGVVVVDHNDIVINGPRKVCFNNTYTYTTVPLANTTYTWKDIKGGKFLSPTSNTYVDIQWDSIGVGQLTLEQTVGAGQPVPRPLDIVISSLPTVTLDDFTTSVCPNEPFDLSTVTVSPVGGVFSGPGVVDGIFYGDQAGGAGNQPITYTYTSDVEPYCVNSDTKDITVYALPNVTLALDSTVFCRSYFPFPLTGGKLDGVDVDGTYSGPGVTGNELDPSVAGVGTHEITFSYTDGTTGCTNTSKQNITINDAPNADFIVPNTDVCESEDSLNLNDFVSPTGTFYLNDDIIPVIIPNGIFDATKAGLGTHRIEFYTDNKIGNCPGMAYVNLNVVSVPGKPTIIPGPSQVDPTYLESSAPSGNTHTWYREGSIIDSTEGRNDKRINPRVSGNYTVTTTAANCESFPSDPYNFTYIPPSDSLSTELSEQGEILPGKIVTLDIKIGNEKVIKDNNIDSISFEIVYNASMLYPQFTPMGTVLDRRRTIPIGIKIDDTSQISNGSKLLSLEFRATLGSEESTQLKFNNLIAWSKGTDTKSEIGIKNLTFSIKVNKNSGKPLLFGEPPLQVLMTYSIMPNPVSESFKLDYSMIKGEWINIYITNINGQILKKIYDGEAKDGNNSTDIDASELNTGSYYLILQTIYEKQTIPLHIIK